MERAYLYCLGYSHVPVKLCGNLSCSFAESRPAMSSQGMFGFSDTIVPALWVSPAMR